MTVQRLTYRHRDGCGRPAFVYEKDKLMAGRGLDPKYALNTDGTPVLPNDEVVCGSCGKPLRTPLRWEYFE